MRIARLVWLAILLVAGGAVGAWSWQLAQHVGRLEHAASLTHARIDRVQELIDEFAAEELVYVNSGRTSFDNVTAASELLRRVKSEAVMLVGEALEATSASAQPVIEATATLGDAAARAQENLAAGLDLMAAELAFTDTQALRRSLRQDLRRLAVAELAAVSRARTDALTQGGAALLGVALLFTGALVWWSRVPSPKSAPAIVSAPPHGATLRLLETTPEIVPERSLSPDLQAAADVCTALGRLTSADDLPGLLKRVTSTLDASGVVIWMAAGEELFAAAAYGYPPQVMQQLGPINRSAINATAAAWRNETLQVVSAESGSKSAVAIPMLGPDRCIGVLAIEVAGGRETHNGVQAIASLFAAQLAAALAGWPPASTAAPVNTSSFNRAAEA